jgi:hypothetical protein
MFKGFMLAMSARKIFAITASLAVLIAIVAIFMVTGPPEAETDPRLDDRRVADLQRLAGVISVYHEETSSLPVTLAALADGQTLQSEPLDPVTSEPYGYEVEANEAYSLCATFDNSSDVTQQGGFWLHDAGRVCFRLSPAYGEF